MIGQEDSSRLTETKSKSTPKLPSVRLPPRKQQEVTDDIEDEDVIIVDPPSKDTSDKTSLKRKRDSKDTRAEHHHKRHRHRHRVMGELNIQGITDGEGYKTASRSSKKRKTPLLQSQISSFMSPKTKPQHAAAKKQKPGSKIVVSESDSDEQGKSDIEDDKENDSASDDSSTPFEDIDDSSQENEDASLDDFIVEELSESEAQKDIYHSPLSSDEEGGDNSVSGALAGKQTNSTECRIGLLILCSNTLKRFTDAEQRAATCL